MVKAVCYASVPNTILNLGKTCKAGNNSMRSATNILFQYLLLLLQTRQSLPSLFHLQWQ